MACIELPKDAEGREIPLDTEVLYLPDGSRHKVYEWSFYPHQGWSAILEMNNTRAVRDPDKVYLTPPDSWELLLADLYDPYKHITHSDIAMRIRKLRGEDK